MRDSYVHTECPVRHTKCGRMRGMVVGEGGRSSGVLLYNDSLKKKKKKKFFFSVSLYSVQNIAIHRIRLIFDSSNTLVYRDGPTTQYCSVRHVNLDRILLT